jgi:hypothetical protein
MTQDSSEPVESGGWSEALGEHATNPSTPRTTGEVLYALGREWTVSSLEARIKAQFENWVRARAKQVIAEEGNPEEQEALRGAYMAARSAGHYDWDGRYCRNARADVPGLRHLLFLLLRRCQPEVTQEEVVQMFRECPKDCGMVIGWAAGNSLPPNVNVGGNKTAPKESPTQQTVPRKGRPYPTMDIGD